MMGDGFAHPRADAGKYQPIAQLGSGGSAEIFLAAARGPSGVNKLVVLKAPRSNLGADAELAQMFVNEARLSARLSHPNVVHVYEIAEEPGGPVIVMEYLEGASLNHVTERGRETSALSLGVRLRIVSEALAGLHYAHELADYDGSPLGIVHRDVSPHNIYVTFDGQVKMLDFGIALAKGISSETATGVIKGKIRYMAPEQICSSPVDRRADLYSMGVVLWELATGLRIWNGCSDVETMNRVLNQGPPRAVDVNPSVLPRLDAIIARALAREPDDRYATALELQSDLDSLLDEIGGHVSNRAVGKVVEELFSDLRGEQRQAIERLLSSARAAETEPPSPFAPTPSLPTLTSPSATRPHRERGVSSTTPASPRSKGRKARRLRALGITAAAVALATLTGASWHVTKAAGAASATAAAAPRAPELPQTHVEATPPSSSADALQTSEVRVIVRATPARSRVFVDDVLLAGEPPSGAYVADAALHRVRIEHAGYQPWSSRVAFDRDVDLVVTLQRSASPARAATLVTPAPVESSAPSARPPEPPRNQPRPLDTALPW